MKRIPLFLLCVFPIQSSFAAAQGFDCTSIKNREKRLACYDSSAMRTRQKETLSTECKFFEKQSNAMSARFEVGFNSPDSYQAPLSDLVVAFNECASSLNIESSLKLNAYRKNIAAYKMLMEFWRQGINECIEGDRLSQSAGASGWSNCSWKQMPYNQSVRNGLFSKIKAKYPEIIAEGIGADGIHADDVDWNYGHINDQAFRQIVRFR